MNFEVHERQKGNEAELPPHTHADDEDSIIECNNIPLPLACWRTPLILIVLA